MDKSESIIEISKALINAQTELKNIHQSKTNPFYKSKYAPLEDILDAVKPVLQKYKLAIVQTLSGIEDKICINTILLHESGEYISDSLPLKPTKNDPQQAGSAITYGRRYSINAFLNISSDEDDDGNSGTRENKTTKEPTIKEQIKTVKKDILTLSEDSLFSPETSTAIKASTEKAQTELSKGKKPTDSIILMRLNDIYKKANIKYTALKAEHNKAEGKKIIEESKDDLGLY